MTPEQKNTILNWGAAGILAACIGAVIGFWLSENRFSDTETVDLLQAEKARSAPEKTPYKNRVGYCDLRIQANPIADKSLYSATLTFSGWRKGKKTIVKSIFYQLPQKESLGKKTSVEILSPGREVQINNLLPSKQNRWIKRLLPEKPLVIYDGTPGSLIFSFDLPLLDPKCTLNFNF